MIITLTTDWGQNDFYTGMLKGRIISSFPNATLIDLAHNVPQYSIDKAAFIVRHSYSSFPAKSVHLLMVNSEIVVKSRFLVTENSNHIFVIPDNGALSLLFNSPPEKVYAVNYEVTGSFASLNCITTIFSKLASNQPLGDIGELTNDYITKTPIIATWDESLIIGNVIYIDSYYNAISNISRNIFDKIGQNRQFDIYVQSHHNRVKNLSITYNQVPSGELLALFNSADLLEVAIRDGFAAQLLNLSVGSEVKVKFATQNRIISGDQPTLW